MTTHTSSSTPAPKPTASASPSPAPSTQSTPSPPSIACHWLLASPGREPALAHQLITLASGHIAAIEPFSRPPAGTRRVLALPALANAHDHGRPLRSSSMGAYGQPLEGWLPFMGLLPGVDAYLCAAVAFARLARRGVAHTMVHYTRVQGLTPYADEAEAVARAARDVGLRIGFAVAMRDRHGLGYADDVLVLQAVRPSIRDAVGQRLHTPARSPADWLAKVDEVAARVHEAGHDDHVNVQYGPAAVQWCSMPLLEAIARASADTGRRVHMHLLETPYQRAWADRHHPGGIVRFLDALGLLSPRLTVAHCTHARPDELALLAERGVGIAVNTSSNLGLKSGIAPLAEMLRQGCRVAMGLDGMSLDEDDDALRELRLAWLLHRGRGFDVEMTAAQLWDFGAVHGRHTVMGPHGQQAGAGRSTKQPVHPPVVPPVGQPVDQPVDQPGGQPGGHLAVGAPADLMLLDWDAVDDEAVLPGLDPLDLLLAHASAAHITDVFIAGRQVVHAGRVTGVDELALRSELLARLRSAVAARPEVDAWRRTLGELAEDLGPFYRQGRYLGCC